MKKNPLCVLIAVFYCTTSFEQTDTTYQYFNKSWKASSKDSAYYYSAFYTGDGLFKRRDVILKTNTLFMDGGFTDKELKTRQGTFKWYYDNGTVKDSVLYDKGKRTAGWYFYENGKLKAVISLADSKVTEQKGWDENGKEIANYIVDEPAQFPGGMQGWKRYLEKNLNSGVAAGDGAPNGNYPVKIQFEIDTEGNVSNIQPITVPPLCPGCAPEAVRIIRTGPKWIPAVQFGKPVTYKMVQFITFQVAGDNTNTPVRPTRRF